MEHNESPEDTVKREALEETGLIIEPILKGIITYPQTNNDEYLIAFVFIAKKFTGELIECNEGNLEWIKNSEIEKLPMWEGDKLFLPLLKKEGIFSAKITYNKDEVIDSQIEIYK